MKKNFLFLFIGFLLVIPVTASADIIGTVTLNEGLASYESGQFIFPVLGTEWVYDDYNVTISGASIVSNGIYDAFCVENAWSEGENNLYTLLSIDSDLESFGLSVDDFYRVSVIAEKYYKQNKEAAQIAIWEIMFDDNSNLDDGYFQYNTGVLPDTINAAISYLTEAAALDYNSNFTSNWVLAVNPTISEDGDVVLASSQNYIFRAYDEPTGPPVPEPSVLLLLGTGLLSVAASGRKRFMK